MTKCLSICLIAILPTLAHAAVTEKQIATRDQVYNFLKSNIMNRSFITQKTMKLNDNKMETEYSTTTKYGNLEVTSAGIRFKLFQTTNQTIWDLDEKGHRIGKGRHENRDFVFQNDLRVSKSTGELIGVEYAIANSTSDSTGTHSSIGMTLMDDVLIIRCVNGMYSDIFDVGNTDAPGRSESTMTLKKIAGKWEKHTSGKSFRVNPTTLENEKQISTFVLNAKELEVPVVGQ